MNQEDMKYSGGLIELMRGSGWTMRSIASVVILTFGGLVTSPAVAAVKQEVQKIQWHKTEEGHGAKLSAQLLAVRDHLSAATKKDLKGASLSDERKQFKDDAAALADFDKQTLADFASTQAMIKDKHLPDVILQRELAAETHYKTEMAALRQGLYTVVNEKDDAKAQADSKYVLDRLSKFQMERSQQKFDPKHLPNRSLKPDLTRKPYTTKKQFAEAGFIGNPRLMVATTAPNFDYSQLPGANNPAYLAATTEVTISPAIQAQAAALNYNPVQIYNWVRNNIVWQPTWGAVQDADLTLSAQRGNAFDISSLLIALLRASNIPARYVLGTINVPADKFRNWVGGFQDINAAVNYASAGGIPITSLYSGGQITTIQMQHIWVEAAIDYMPSHGVINKSADSWVPMDASYKQYQYRQALDVLTISNIDANSLAQQFVASGSVNSQGSWASGQSVSVLQNAATNAQQAIASYVQSHIPNATTEDVIGGADIVKTASQYLSASTPNQVVVAGVRYGQLPTSLEQSINFAFGTDPTGEPINPISVPWPKLNNQLITLSFEPATQSDMYALNALASVDPSTGQTIFPTSIPGYLINVVPTLRVNGNALAAGSPMAMGTDLTFSFTPSFVGRSNVPFTYDLAAGSYVAFSVIAGNVSPIALSTAQSQLQSVVSGTSSGDLRETALGSAFEAGLLGYYLQYMDGARFLGSRQGGNLYLAAGLGSFGLEPTVNYAFGIPTALTGAQLVLNLPMVNIFGFDGSNSQARLNYVLGVGQLSSVLEYAVPNQLFAGSVGSLGGASAETALAAASAQGQSIYHIAQSNETTILPLLNQSATVMSDIENGIAAGKEAVVSSSAVSVPGFTGSGYIIYDPQTGDGAYKIAGGQNGFKSNFDPALSYYLDLWELLFWAIKGKYLNAAGMAITAVSFVSDLVVIQKHCSGTMLLRYTFDYSALFIFLIALSALVGPLGVVLISLLSPFILGFAMDMITAECDSFPNG